MKPGIYLDRSAEDYQSATDGPCLTASLAKILCSSSPLHCWTASPALNPNYVSEEKEIFDLGTVAHALMLQGIEIGRVLDFPDWKTAQARGARDAARAVGQVPILKKHWDRVKAMVEAGKRQIAEHKEASDAFTGGSAETTIIWFDEEFHVWCKSRLDYLQPARRRIIDYKSTGTSANPESIAKFAIAQGFDIQSAFYLRGMKALTGEEHEFLFVVQETEEPFALTVIGMGPDFLWNGNSKITHAMGIWAECLKSGKWPAYPDRIVYPVLPAWEESRTVNEEEIGRWNSR